MRHHLRLKRGTTPARSTFVMTGKVLFSRKYVITVLASSFQSLLPILLMHGLVAFDLSAFDFHTAFVADDSCTMSLNHIFDYTIIKEN